MARGPGRTKPGPTPSPGQEGTRNTSRTSTAKRTTLDNSESTARATAEAIRDHRGTKKDSTNLATLCGKETARAGVSHGPSSAKTKSDTSRNRVPNSSNDSG